MINSYEYVGSWCYARIQFFKKGYENKYNNQKINYNRIQRVF